MYLSDKQFENAVELIKSSIALSIHMTKSQYKDDDELQHVLSIDDNPPSVISSRASLQASRTPRLQEVSHKRSTVKQARPSATVVKESTSTLGPRTSAMSIKGIKERISKMNISRQLSHKQPSMDRTPSFAENRSNSKVIESKQSVARNDSKLSVGRKDSKFSIARSKLSTASKLNAKPNASKLSTNSRSRSKDQWNPTKQSFAN